MTPTTALQALKQLLAVTDSDKISHEEVLRMANEGDAYWAAIRDARAALSAPAQDAQADEREAFEAWITSVATFEDYNGAVNLRYLGLHKHYVDFDVDRAWQVWQARAARTQPATPAAQDAVATVPLGELATEWIAGRAETYAQVYSSNTLAEAYQAGAEFALRSTILQAAAAPQAAQPAGMVPLTDAQIDGLPWHPQVTVAEGLRDFAREVERAHGIGTTATKGQQS